MHGIGLNGCTKLPSFIENDILDKLIKKSQYVDINDNIKILFEISYSMIFNTNNFDKDNLIKNFYLTKTIYPPSNIIKPLCDINGQQISALVQQENYYYTSAGQIDYNYNNGNPEISTYILPRYTFDDLMHWDIYFDKYNYQQRHGQYLCILLFNYHAK